MRITLVAFVVAFGVTLGVCLLVAGGGPEATADPPRTAGAPPPAGPGTAEREVQDIAARVLAQAATASPATADAPDLALADELVAHMYGEPIPWDSDEQQAAESAAFTEAAAAFEASGLGRMTRLDCDSYPCMAVLETDPADGNISEALREHLPDVEAWTSFEVEAEGGTVRRHILHRSMEDISPWDPQVQRRRMDLTVEAQMPPHLLPTEEDARRPVVWPELDPP